jgi:glycosyltransferase involved in cell wall biosynthesis
MTERPAQLVILEPGYGGHRLHFVRLLAEQSRRSGGQSALITTPHCLDSREYAVHLDGLVARGDLELILVDEPEGGPKDFRGLRRLCHLAGQAALARGGVITIPDGDRFVLPLLTLRRPVRINLLLMRAWPFDRSARARALFAVKREATRLLRRTGGVRVVCLQNPLDPLELRLPHDGVACDPLPRLAFDGSREAARRAMQLPADRCIVGIIGNLSEHKAIGLALAAWARVTDRAEHPPLLVVAGRATPAIQTLLETGETARLVAEGKLEVREGYMSDHDLDALLVAVDAVLLPYTYEASSGTLNRVVQTDTAVIAAGSSTVARAVVREGLGITCALTIEGLVAGIATLAAGPIRRSSATAASGDTERAWAQALSGATG